MFRVRGYRFQDDPYIATVTAMSVIPPTAIFLSTTLIDSFVPRTDIRKIASSRPPPPLRTIITAGAKDFDPARQ